jgi:hypothetical protein
MRITTAKRKTGLSHVFLGGLKRSGKCKGAHGTIDDQDLETYLATRNMSQVRKRQVMALLGLLFAVTLSAQEPLNYQTFDSTEVYTLQYPTGGYKHPDGDNVTAIVVLGLHSGKTFKTWIRDTNFCGLKPGDEVEIKPSDLP